MERAVRLANLTIALLTARGYLSGAELQRFYGDSLYWNRTFERDKKELRGLGIEIETGVNGSGQTDETGHPEIGYRIRRDSFELPQVDFTPAEGRALAMAAGVWRQAHSASATGQAVLKLRAGGADIDVGESVDLRATLAAREPAFEPLWRALRDLRVVEFTYRGSDEVRRVDPWSLRSRNGAWYLIGYDHARSGTRVFKLARITSPRAIGAAWAVSLPDDIDLRALGDAIKPTGPDDTAIVLIAHGAAPTLRRSGTLVEIAGPVPQGYDAVEVEYTRWPGFVGELAAYGTDVLVYSPRELRDAVLAVLCGVIGGESMPPQIETQEEC